MSNPTATHGRPEAAARPAGEAKPADVRQFVSFSFYRIDPEWRRLRPEVRATHIAQLISVLDQQRQQLVVCLTYSLVGLKADADFLVWSVATSLEALQATNAAILRSGLGAYLRTPYLYLSMTKRSTYDDKIDPAHPEQRRTIKPFHSKYLFIYPFWKTAEWYMLPKDQRQAMMDEHIQTGNMFPSVRIHTTYSFGLDDPEFMLAFETDEPKDFLDLVMTMRENKARPYTLRDTPIFTCVAKPLEQLLNDVGA